MSSPNPLSNSPAISTPTAPTIAPSSQLDSTQGESSFRFPPHYSFPPFFTLQPNLSTRASQLSSWSALVQSYCRHHRLFSLHPHAALSTPLFANATLNKRLGPRDALAIFTYMASAEGGWRAEWADAASSAKSRDKEDLATAGKVWVYWRRPEEWADMLDGWVDATGQKGAVLTLYELTESDAVRGQDWVGMDGEMLRKSLNVLVKKGRAQVFGQGEDLGVKFF